MIVNGCSLFTKFPNDHHSCDGGRPLTQEPPLREEALSAQMTQSEWLMVFQLMLPFPWTKLKWSNGNWKATAKKYPPVGQPWPSGAQGCCRNIGLKLWLWQSHESAATGKIAITEHCRMRCPVFLSHFYTLDFFPQKQLRSPFHNRSHGG